MNVFRATKLYQYPQRWTVPAAITFPSPHNELPIQATDKMEKVIDRMIK